MRKGLFIIALILIIETLFRLFPFSSESFMFFPLNPIRLNLDTYVYFLFEYVKVIGLVYVLYIENTRYRFLLWMFSVDLIIFILNYNSTLTYVSGFPIGADTMKLFIFGIVIIREALNYHNGLRTDHDEHRDTFAYAHGHVSKKVRIFQDKKSIEEPKQTNGWS